MSSEAVVKHVVERLQSAGWMLRRTPVMISRVSFDFAALFVGSEQHSDLIVVLDALSPSPIDERRIRQNIEALSRSLDVASSRRPLTVVLVGEHLSLATRSALSRVARVLVVTPEDLLPLDDVITRDLAVLLPLVLPELRASVKNPSKLAWERLKSESQELGLSEILDAAKYSGSAVERQFRTSVVNILNQEGH